MNDSKKYSFFGLGTSEGALGKNKGCEKAPAHLAKLLSLSVKDFILSKNDIELQQKQIFENAKKVFEIPNNGIPFFIGGTHDITFSIFKAFAKVNPNSSLLVFDAHADCDEGLVTPSHEDFIRALVEQKIVAPKNILLFGLRKIYSSEKNFLKESGVKQIYLNEINSTPTKVKKALLDFIGKATNLYVSFDVDVLNSEIMQATGYVHKGGLSLLQAKQFLGIVFAKAKAIDFVEFNPKKVKKRENKLLFSLFKGFL